tara:strand:- start:396 stop:1250 length:855 start_codon:yes stop_codon:yes gene_type:complete
MEMIDVLTKLKEIAESKPELVKDAVENVEKTNPKVDESATKRAMEDDAESMTKEQFIEKYGSAMAGFWEAYNGTEEAVEGKMPAGLKAYHDKKAGKEDKKETVKEAIQISTDSPQEASMMMQILKLAGVQQVDPSMMGAEPEHGSDMDPGAMNKQMDVPGDDAMRSMQMGKMRDMMTAPDEEKAAETFANEPEEKVQDVDSLVNKHSGGLNRQKKTHMRVSPGDNPMAAEDKITEQDLANSLRAQYESFKTAYQEAAKPDFLDMDKDGDKKEPMKKAIKDKEAK